LSLEETKRLFFKKKEHAKKHEKKEDKAKNES